tara:strand:+ start:239 stop:340 length:102 start_codon:yes stop_codon:yes gene_type:complete
MLLKGTKDLETAQNLGGQQACCFNMRHPNVESA